MRWGSNELGVEIFVFFIMIITTIITIASSSSILISAGTIGMRWGSNELEVEEGDGVSWVT